MSSPRKGALRRAEARQALGFVSPALLGLGLFTLFPVGLSIVMSLFNWPTFGARTFNGLGNYIKLFTVSPDFWPAMRNTFVFAITYVPINIALSLGLAVALNSRIRGRGALRVLFFIPVVTPMVANILVWKMLLQPKGALNGISEGLFNHTLPSFLADPFWAMVMVVTMSVWQGLGYNMLIFSAVLEQLPDSVIEAARIDGATGARLFFRVTLPMISRVFRHRDDDDRIAAGLRPTPVADRRWPRQLDPADRPVHLQQRLPVPGSRSGSRSRLDPVRRHHRPDGLAVPGAEEVGAL